MREVIGPFIWLFLAVMGPVRVGGEGAKAPWVKWDNMQPEWTKKKEKLNPGKMHREARKKARERVANISKKLLGQQMIMGPDGQAYLPKGDFYFGYHKKNFRRNKTEIALKILQKLAPAPGTFSQALKELKVGNRLALRQNLLSKSAYPVMKSREELVYRENMFLRMRRRRKRNKH
ncbi:hypothetical protein AAMO2058_000444400 [Amorphochlora amoebiformis]